MTQKSHTFLTLEIFDEKIMPRLEKIMEEYRKEVQSYKVEVQEYKNDVVGYREETSGEIQKLRNEVIVALHQYKRTNRRVDLIDKHLDINTSDLD